MTSRDNLFARVTHLIGANSTAGKVDKKREKKFTTLTRTTLCCTISVSFDFLLWKFLLVLHKSCRYTSEACLAHVYPAREGIKRKIIPAV